jgi:hypothetical protein
MISKFLAVLIYWLFIEVLIDGFCRYYSELICYLIFFSIIVIGCYIIGVVIWVKYYRYELLIISLINVYPLGFTVLYWYQSLTYGLFL